MNERTAIFKLKNLQEQDPEISHKEADEVLCDLLKELGYRKVVIEFKKVKKWYS